jgi:hypothetical protein
VNPSVTLISAESERQEIEKSRNDADTAKSRALAAQAKAGNSAGQKLYTEAKDLYDLGASQLKQKQINDALTSFKKARQQFDAAEAEWRNSIQSIAPKSPDLATIILTPAPIRTPTASPTVRPRPKLLTGAEINSARALAQNARARALNSKPLSVDVKQDKNFQAGETNMNSGNWDMFSPEERVKYYNNAAIFFGRAAADWQQRLQDPPQFPRNTPRSTRSRVRAPAK